MAGRAAPAVPRRTRRAAGPGGRGAAAAARRRDSTPLGSVGRRVHGPARWLHRTGSARGPPLAPARSSAVGGRLTRRQRRHDMNPNRGRGLFAPRRLAGSAPRAVLLAIAILAAVLVMLLATAGGRPAEGASSAAPTLPGGKVR